MVFNCIGYPYLCHANGDSSWNYVLDRIALVRGAISNSVFSLVAVCFPCFMICSPMQLDSTQSFFTP